MVPEGWRVQSIGNWIAERREKTTVQDQYPVLTSSRNGLVLQTDYYGENRLTKRDNRGFHVIPNGYITYRSRSDDGFFFFNMNSTGATGCVSHFYPVFDFPRGSNQFFLELLNYHRRRLFGFAVGTSQKVLSMNALRSIRFPTPPLAEQMKIAEILSTWDKAIETSEKLLANAEAQKCALMQQLLTGKRRHGEFAAGKWRPFRLDELAELNPKRASPTPDTATFVPMDAVSESGHLIKRETRATKDLSNGYTAFAEGDVLVAKITPCFENGKGCHATGLSNNTGFGSTEFHVLRAFNPEDQRLLYHVTNSHRFRGLGKVNMTGSAGQKRVPADFIASYTLELPENPDERSEIASILDLAVDLISNLSMQKQHLLGEKQALMQQLLTGKKRVKV